MCIVDKNHCGFYMDAADSNKFSIPTTTSTAKQLSKLWRVKQKLTCIQMFNYSKSLYFYRTLPDVPTGGNLTCTILQSMFGKKDLFGDCTDVHINVDGSGDNINYTVVYALVYILLCAYVKKQKLTRIHLLRMRPGHTHNELDAAFALLSKIVYGKHSRGDPRKDVLSFQQFIQVRHACNARIYNTHLSSHSHIIHTYHLTHQVCREVYRDRLVEFEDVRGVYDFDNFLKSYRPKKADSGIQKHFAIDFERRVIDGEVYVFTRSKSAISAKIPWSDWTQIYPSLLDGRGVRSHHPPSTVPPVMQNKQWENFESHVVPTLKK